MRIMHRLALISVAAVVLAASAANPVAQTADGKRGFLWKVERGGKTSWLAGSLHMMTPDAYPLPTAMTQAFASSDALVEEADPDELASPEFALTLLTKALYPEGQSLEDHVSAATFRMISERGSKAGLPVEMLRRMKPWMVSTTLQALELQNGGFDPALGLDVHFHGQAKTMRKRFVPLETGLEQVSFLENLGTGLEDAIIRENVEGAETEVAEVRKIAAAWQKGDAAALEQLILGSMKDSPAVYQSLIVSRNRAWVPKLRACIDTSRCFIVVGAAHLVGPEGVVALLRAQGYAVTQQ